MDDRHSPLPPLFDPPGEPDPLVGRLLSGRYRLIEPIASGGMGTVYLGEHVHLRKRVAVKILLPDAAKDPQMVGRFEREAIAGAHVSHPHVVVATDFGKEPDGFQFLVLEYVSGVTLADVLEDGPLEVPEALKVARQLARGLNAVHEKGIIHRDIKPKNVILSDIDGSAKLVDFGFAKIQVDRLSMVDPEEAFAAEHRDLTLVGTVFGTVAYMAPEIVNGMDQLDPRADLYALGVTLYEMLSGVLPFQGANNAELFQAISAAPPPPIEERAPGLEVPYAVEALVRKLLEKDPAARFQTAAELLQALEVVSAKVAEGAHAPLPPLPRGELPAPVLAPESGVTGWARGVRAQLSSLAGGAWSALGGLGANLRSSTQRRPAAAGVGSETENAAAALLRTLGGRRSVWFLGVPLVALCVAAVVWASTRSEEAESRPETVAPAVNADAPAQPVEVVIEVDGVDVDGWTARLAEAAREKVHSAGATAFLAIAKLDPTYFRRPSVRADALATIVGIAYAENEQADRVFDVLTNQLGQDGLELLYEIVRSKGGTKAHQRALGLLRDPAVLARTTPALRVALDLRQANCPGKRALFSRAVREGDGRVLTELKALKYAPCSRKTDPCCFRDDAELAEAIDQLAARIR
jgi:serine/threonine-protein kinase